MDKIAYRIGRFLFFSMNLIKFKEAAYMCQKSVYGRHCSRFIHDFFRFVLVWRRIFFLTQIANLYKGRSD